MIIVLYGPSRAGKDSIANILGNKERFGKARFKRLAFGDRIRQILLDLNPWLRDNDGDIVQLRWLYEECDGDWDVIKAKASDSVEFMVRLGQGARDIIGENVWVDPVIPHLKNRQNYVITDCRQPNELNALQERGAYFWKVERPGKSTSRGMDGLLDKFEDWDAVIVNDGTLKDLEKKVLEELDALKARSSADAMKRYKARRFAEDPDWERRDHLRTRYNLTMEEFDVKLQEQNGLCALCLKRPQELLAVDHDHRCCPGIRTCGECLRGLLCTGCNMWIEVVANDIEWLDRARAWIDTRWREQ